MKAKLPPRPVDTGPSISPPHTDGIEQPPPGDPPRRRPAAAQPRQPPRPQVTPSLRMTFAVMIESVLISLFFVVLAGVFYMLFQWTQL